MVIISLFKEPTDGFFLLLTIRLIVLQTKQRKDRSKDSPDKFPLRSERRPEALSRDDTAAQEAENLFLC